MHSNVNLVHRTSPQGTKRIPRAEFKRCGSVPYLGYTVFEELLFCSMLISSNIDSYGIRECDLTVWTPQGERSELFKFSPANMI